MLKKKLFGSLEKQSQCGMGLPASTPTTGRSTAEGRQLPGRYYSFLLLDVEIATVKERMNFKYFKNENTKILKWQVVILFEVKRILSPAVSSFSVVRKCPPWRSDRCWAVLGLP